MKKLIDKTIEYLQIKIEVKRLLKDDIKDFHKLLKIFSKLLKEYKDELDEYKKQSYKVAYYREHKRANEKEKELNQLKGESK